MRTARADARPGLPLALRALPVAALLAIGGQFFASLTNFGTGVIIGRTCGPVDYGLYYLGFTLLTFLLEMQNALISTPYSVYAARLEGEESAQYRGSALLQQGAFSLLACVGFLLGALAGQLGFGPEGMAPVFLALAAVSVFFLLRDQVRRILFAHLQMGRALLCDFALAVLQLAGLALLWQTNAMTAVTAYIVVGGASAAIVAGWLIVEWPRLRFSLSAATASMRKHWHFGKWVVASALIWSLSMNCYPWLIDYYHGTANAGLWAAAFTLVSLGNVFMMGVHNFIGPKIAGVYVADGLAAMRRFVLQVNAAFAVPLLLLSVFLYFAGEPLLRQIYGDAYATGAGLLLVLSLNLAALGLAFVFSRGLFAIERADLDFQVNFVPLVLLFAAGVPLVRSYGINGAAWALCLANVVALGCRMAAFLIAQPREKEATP